ncbi:hypothetical protein EP331_14900 [bacterium]|nr:MAG: hypothetical protein EP331_14900 [bacterium]
MKKLLFITGIILIQFCVPTQYVPTPTKTLPFVVLEDTTYSWKLVNMQQSPSGYIAEAVRKHESLTNWTELYQQWVHFSNKPFDEFLTDWEASIKNLDTNAKFEKVILSPLKVYVKYQVKDEVGLFVNYHEKDGIYQNAWMYKYGKADSVRVQFFEEKLKKSEIGANPHY